MYIVYFLYMRQPMHTCVLAAVRWLYAQYCEMYKEYVMM